MHVAQQRVLLNAPWAQGLATQTRSSATVWCGANNKAWVARGQATGLTTPAGGGPAPAGGGEGRCRAGSTHPRPDASPGTPPPPRSLRRCSATFFLAAEESPTSEGLQTKRFWSLAEEKLAGSQWSWQTLGGLHFPICRRQQRCVCLHRLLAPPPRRPPPPAHRRYWRGWALQGVRSAVCSECECYVRHYGM